MPEFSLLFRPVLLSVHLLPTAERSPTIISKLIIRSFGVMLEPRYIFGAKPLD